MKFSKEYLLDDLDSENTVVEEIVGKRRWVIDCRRVFKFEGRFYETHYSVSATEAQYERPYQYDPEEIECKEVFPVPSIVYR